MSYRLNQATGGILTTSVGNQETGQRRVTGTHSATNLNRLVHSVPDTLLGDQHCTTAAEGGKHVLDAVAEQLLGGAGGQLGASLQLLPVIATGQLSQLLRVGLNQGGLVLTGDGRDQRRLRGINSNLALVAGGAQCRHQLGIVGRLQARRQRTGQNHPVGALGTLNHQRIQLLTQFGVKNGAGGVQLGGGAIRINHGNVRANRLTGGQVSELNIHSLQCGQHRVGGFTGHDGEGRHAGNLQGAGNIHALATGILYGTDSTLHGTVSQGCTEFNGAVQAGVGGQSNNH